MRVKLADIPAAVTATLLNIRAGILAARQQGLIAELPEKVDFQIEVISDYQALVEAESGTNGRTTNTANTKPELAVTTERTGGGATATETQTGTQGQTAVKTGGGSTSTETTGNVQNQTAAKTGGGNVTFDSTETAQSEERTTSDVNSTTNTFSYST